MSKILFITSTRIGDAILSTGLIEAMRQNFENPRITVACGPLVTGFFEAAPHVEEVISLQKRSYSRHWLSLFLQTRKTKWDVVVDLRNSVVSRLLAPKKAYIFGGHIDKTLHKAEQNAAVMELDHVPDPKLWVTEKMKEQASALMKSSDSDAGPIIGVGPSANWLGKTWDQKNFIDLIGRLRHGNDDAPLFKNARFAIFAAPGEEEQAKPVYDALPEDKRIDLIAKGRPELAAACLAACDFYIGNDSGLMHCAAAAGVPTFGLFGPSWPHLYAPWGAYTDYAQTPEDFDALISYEGYHPKTAPSLMTTLTVDHVETEITRFFNDLPEDIKSKF